MSAALRKTYDRYAWIMAVLTVPLSRKKSHLEEILALRRVWITLRQQLHECLSPVKGELSGSC